eukprot:COSAG05_NODE_12977_length_446_cov_0.962536_1_plen_67_part_10
MARFSASSNRGLSGHAEQAHDEAIAAGVVPESLDVNNIGHAQLIERTKADRDSGRRSGKALWNGLRR